MMFSISLTELLERARARFGVEVEVLDASLASVYPAGATSLAQGIEQSAVVRASLSDAIRVGRPCDIEALGASYRVYPLRPSHHQGRQPSLVVVRRASATVPIADLEPWSEFARAVVESDLASGVRLGEEQERSRRLAGVLRFVEHLADVDEEAEILQSLTQAFAVWFDVDARIYRRVSAGHFELCAWLPGVEPDAASRRLDVLEPVSDIGTDGLMPTVGASNPRDRHDLLAAVEGEWAVSFAGNVSPEALTTTRMVLRLAGQRLGAVVAARREQLRQRFESLVASSSAAELIAIRLVRELVTVCGAAGGTLTLLKAGKTRRIAAVSATQERQFPTLPDLTQVRRIPFMPGGEAVLEVHYAASGEAPPSAAAALDACGTVLRVWLAGAFRAFDQVHWPLEGAAVPPFVTRIHEELERARRFDLSLSLILIQISAPATDVAVLQRLLRHELRGSDLLGEMDGQQVAALLTHTNQEGLENVVRRIRDRLIDTVAALDLSGLRLGQAVLSPECRSAEALLSLAADRSELIIH
jgi:hypothetical protein